MAFATIAAPNPQNSLSSNVATRIAALLTSYNRKTTTLSALSRLLEQKFQGVLTVFLVDDNSSDGTGDAIAKIFPQVRLLKGDGNLFWCGGMRRAFEAACKEKFDFYLWLNDDTVLESDAIQSLLDVSTSVGETSIVVGSTRDSQTGAHTYGGVVRSSRLHPFKYRLVSPQSWSQECDTINGNCVLIPRKVAESVENLSPEFRHGIADFDYGLRARKLGFKLIVAPGFIGFCSNNSLRGHFRDPQGNIWARWQHIFSRKGLPPKEYLVYARRHGGPVWPVFWAMPYVNLALRSLLDALGGLGTKGQIE